MTGAAAGPDELAQAVRARQAAAAAAAVEAVARSTTGQHSPGLASFSIP